jgi:glycosyltransferase involved in cell wall biosynthesis
MQPVGRNQPCPCGSGKAYKNCHGVLRTLDGKPALPGLLRSEDRQRRMVVALEAQRSARVAEAAALYQSVLNEEPDNFDALHMLGVARYELGELPQAEALVRRAIAVNPGVASAHANLRLIRAAQEWSGAEEQLCREVEQMRTLHRQVDSPAISSDVRVIAFYLPQYHPIPENDRWWGAGFTEWTNVRKGLPNFVGHEQPHEPAELGYYDLSSAEVRARQAGLAREFGIHGFCYYTYWFNGKRLLERPLDEVLTSGTPDLPFCVCWANENWTRRWDGLDQDILIGQDYSTADSTAFIRQLLPVLGDPRYIRVDGRPLLLVYKLDLIPQARAMADVWRREARQHGLGELYLCAVRTTFHSDPSAFGFDAVVEFPPHGFHAYRLNAQMQITNPEFRGMVFNYRHQVIQSLDETPCDYTTFRCVMPGWDNTARRRHDSTVFIRSSPDLFEYWLHAMIEQTRRRLPMGRRLVFVNAWNEWGEGCHLEPDRRSGRGYLAAVRNALVRPTRDLPPVVPFDPFREADMLLTEYTRDPALQIRQFAPAGAAPAQGSLVSIVVPAYNHAAFLREAIGSVFAQTHSAIELIVVDDGSTDWSFELLTELANGARCPVVLIRQPNGGAPAALNRGLAIARGDYVAILNSDDAFTPTRIETLLAAVRREGAMLAFSGVAFIGADGAFVPRHPLAEKLKAKIDSIHDYPGLLYSLVLSNVAISTGNLLFARALLTVTGGFRDLKLCHDWDFVLAASYAGPPVFVSEPLYHYRLHEANTFAAMRLHGTQETETVYRRFFANIAGHPLLADERERERFLRFAHEQGCRGYFPVPSAWRYRNYAEWVALYGTLGDDRREELRRDIAGFPRRPLLSILLPTHNSAERWLRRCLDSVRGQLYPAWELCIADDASSGSTVRAVLEEYRAPDARIKVAYRAQNGHISRATNSALELATGEFAVLLDHDDELAEDALYWVAREIVESPDVMLIYSDEDKINESGVRFSPYFKPDWNPELLRAQNCISHLAALRTDALRAIGGFRAGLEGAQDWDVALRLSEHCEPEAIRHIPRVLYHWRTGAASTAQSMEGKPYASAAQRQVVAEHLTRIGRVGKVEPVVRRNFWRVNYATHPGSPTTVLVDGRGSIDLLRCTLTALAGARDRTIESFRVLVDSTDAEQVTGQLASLLGVEFETIRVPAATGLGVAWNTACSGCTGELIVLVVAGISGLTPGWCERLIGYAQNADCGVVAPALLLPDGSFHNAGILLDAELATVRAFLGRQKDYRLPGARQALAHNLTVPGSEFLAFRREVHTAIGGFDAHFSDRDLLAADFCLRLRLSGRWNVWTPYVEGLWAGRRVSHWAERHVEEVREFLARWQSWVARDPGYNLNFASGWRTFDLAFPPRNSDAVRTAVPSPVEIETAEVRDHA